MQFSKTVTTYARNYGVEPKDVLFSMLLTAGASPAEALAVIYRPTTSTTAGLTSKASNYIAQRPGLKRLIKHLDQERNQTTDQPTPKRGRPRKTTEDPATNQIQPNKDRPNLDYTDKDAVLQELARIAERCEKESDRLAALREISALQRMKAEAKVEEEKRVNFYIPLSFDRCNELLDYLQRYFKEKEG